MVDLAQISARLDAVERLPRIKAEESIQERLKSKGFSRRDFMKWSGAMTAMLGLPAVFAPSVARAAELA
ncbi:twin-arginine translocation signal domain-containing protein, partial [uncultured Campylobacter sp.]|uniref:twin-arginine translocation signal domain-containing protein n=1 Tax=uncultured Campylobacter sp. TaxID=218934 RepID=UPI002616B4FF